MLVSDQHTYIFSGNKKSTIEIDYSLESLSRAATATGVCGVRERRGRRRWFGPQRRPRRFLVDAKRSGASEFVHSVQEIVS
jgi:hypothetical protein